MLGIIGAAMFYGSSVITPAISVLSAVEGLKVATPAFDLRVPITVVILVTLFAVQSRGTGRVAVLFGPIMVLWFHRHRAMRRFAHLSTIRVFSPRSIRTTQSRLSPSNG